MMLLPLPDLDPAPSAAPVDYAPVLERLAGSAFRRRKKLLGAELEYLRVHGMEEVVRHAGRFVEARLAPEQPENDGRQTPCRGHPAFVAQHATATCCRGCLEIWHAIPKGRALGADEVRWITGLLTTWMCRETGVDPASVMGRPAVSIRPRRVRRRPHNLRLVVAGEEDEAQVEAGPLVLEERAEDGSLLRRWLQMELFGGPA